VSVVNHFGGLEHGHYTCAARSLDGGGWCEFDDRRVERLEMGPVCDDPSAYVLVYARRGAAGAAVRDRFARVRADAMDVDALLDPPRAATPARDPPPAGLPRRASSSSDLGAAAGDDAEDALMASPVRRRSLDDLQSQESDAPDDSDDDPPPGAWAGAPPPGAL